MFSQDYILRLISQAIAVLMAAVKLRKAGRYQEAEQALQQALEQLIGMPYYLINQMDDNGLLQICTRQDGLDLDRLIVIADICAEQGHVMAMRNAHSESLAPYTRALRLYIEIALAPADEDSAPGIQDGLDSGIIGKIETIRKQVQDQFLPLDTKLALLDYYERLMLLDDPALQAEGLSKAQIQTAYTSLQLHMGEI
jgi:tetratricopeptide (TPR) repeat protein